MTDGARVLSATLSESELIAITGYQRPACQLRWLPPIPVGVDDIGALPAVIRRVAP